MRANLWTTGGVNDQILEMLNLHCLTTGINWIQAFQELARTSYAAAQGVPPLSAVSKYIFFWNHWQVEAENEKGSNA